MITKSVNNFSSKHCSELSITEALLNLDGKLSGDKTALEQTTLSKAASATYKERVR